MFKRLFEALYVENIDRVEIEALLERLDKAKNLICILEKSSNRVLGLVESYVSLMELHNYTT